MNMNSIKSVDWLRARSEDRQVRVIDCRFRLDNPLYGQKAYESGHIPGAVYFDLDRDLSGHVSQHGGRHPLPDLRTFRDKLELAGISNETEVIAYDDGDGAFASRCWWLLTFMGHERVYILDGGMKEWQQAGYPVEEMRQEWKRSVFTPKVKEKMLASYDEVKKKSEDGSALLIDSRARPRYLGLEEPIDVRPGRIPGAINKEWTDSFHDGKWVHAEKQAERFAGLDRSEEIIVYCGSGVTAIPNVIALLESGYENVKLYAGGYSDWVSYPDNPVSTGE